MGIIQTLSAIVFNGGGIILILLILIRKGESGGLSSAFGGAGGGDILGVRAQKQLDKVITYIAVFFIAAAILLNTPAVRHHGKSNLLAPKDGQKVEQPKDTVDPADAKKEKEKENK